MAKKKIAKKVEPKFRPKYAVTDKLRKIYQEAGNIGIFILEFKAQNGCIAFAGSAKKVVELEKKLGREIDLTNLTFAQGLGLGTLPGVGKTRVEACCNAVKACKEYYKIK